MDLTGEQWQVLEPLIGDMPRRADGRGRPWRSSQEVWKRHLVDSADRRPVGRPAGAVPGTRPAIAASSALVHDGTLERILEALARDLKERGKLDLGECFIDGTFVVAKKGEGVWEKPSGAKVRSSWQWQTVLVFLSPSVPPRLRPRAGGPRRPHARLPLRRGAAPAAHRRPRLRC